MKKITINFLSESKDLEVPEDTLLLTALGQAGISMDSACGGKGTCGKCKVRVLQGKGGDLHPVEAEHLSSAELEAGIRLACQVKVVDDLHIQMSGQENLATRKIRMIALPEDFVPEVATEVADECRQKSCGGEKTSEEKSYKLAVDMGTTTVVAMLCNFSDGSIADIVSRANPQSAFGGDVISRITYAEECEEQLLLLQSKMIDCINDMTAELMRRNGFDRKALLEIVLAGNTTMNHLVLGINPSSLARAPYHPAFFGPQDRQAEALGLQAAPSANVHVLPIIAGHVGADITAGLLATRFMERKGLQLFIDIGTNGEIVLVKDGQGYACSTAAGPAFEGASIHQGMWAAVGAIEKVVVDGKDLVIEVIGGVKPTGICGSGLIDAVAAALDLGIVLPTGKMLSREEAVAKGMPDSVVRRLSEGEGGKAMILYPAEEGQDVLLTQKDIREVQLAKGAISAGISLLLAEAGAQSVEIDEITLAGAFGNYIDRKSAMRIGLFPDVALDKIVSVGNAAGAGTAMAALSRHEREKSWQEADRITHVDLSAKKEFQEEYLNAMSFPRKV